MFMVIAFLLLILPLLKIFFHKKNSAAEKAE